MSKFLHNRATYILVALSAIVFVLYMIISLGSKEEKTFITAIVDRGTVEQLVSVSGVIEAEQTAELAFPVSGIVSAVHVTEGDFVEEGQELVTLDSRALAADRKDAQASLERAVATRNELSSGASANTRNTNNETITLREISLTNTATTQAEIVSNTYQTLLSSDLEAISDDPDEDAIAPTISGAYTCDKEGQYVIETYSSGAESGYSYRLSGLETGTQSVSSGQPTNLGTCGLRVLFDANSRYRDTTWIVKIPNTNSSQHVQNRNAYNLAKTQAANAVSLAQQDLALAQATANSSNAPARSEAIARANADITSANARIARIDSQIADRTIRAPFAGTITDIDILPGETATTLPVVTLLAQGAFELTARVPEIDVGKLEIGQKVRAVFDARSSETIHGTIDFIALKATEIDGVAYYEATITLDENPVWLRSGLNSDIDIVITKITNTLRLPRRFVTTDSGESSVTTQSGSDLSTTTVQVLLSGDDGYIAIAGIKEGATVVAPETSK